MSRMDVFIVIIPVILAILHEICFHAKVGGYSRKMRCDDISYLDTGSGIALATFNTRSAKFFLQGAFLRSATIISTSSHTLPNSDPLPALMKLCPD